MSFRSWFLWHLWGRYSSWGAWRIGKRDGIKDQPDQNATEVSYFRDLEEVAEGQIREELVTPFNEERSRYSARYNSAKAHYDNIIDKYTQAKEKVGEAEEYYKQTHENQPPPAKLHNRMLLLVLASILLMAVELPINIVAFRLFYEAEVMTWLMALSPGVLLVIAGDVLGWELKREKKRAFWIITASVISLAVILFSVFLGMVRGEYMATVAKEEGGSASGASHLWWGFVVLNIAFFVVAVAMSRALHDESYQALYVAKKEYERLAKMKERAEAELKDALADYESRFRYYQTKAKALKDTAQHLMQVYIEANLLYRKDKTRPAVFNKSRLPQINLDIFANDSPPPIS